MDRILIQDLLLRCVIGIFPHEREIKQDVIFNLTLFTDLHRAGQTDDIVDTVDYKSLKNQIIEFVEPSSFSLIETLAEGVARICLEQAGVSRVTVRVDKPGALRFARSVAVEIER